MATRRPKEDKTPQYVIEFRGDIQGEFAFTKREAEEMVEDLLSEEGVDRGDIVVYALSAPLDIDISLKAKIVSI